MQSPLAPPIAPKIQRIALVAIIPHGGLGASVRDAFEALGRTVTVIPYLSWLDVAPRIPFRGGGFLRERVADLVRPLAEVRLLAALRAARPDLIFIIKSDDLHASTYAAIRRLTRAPIIAFHPDDPWRRWRGLRPGPAHRRSSVQIASVDAMFLWSDALVARARAEGAARAFYLPFACDPALHPRLTSLTPEEQRTYGADVAFIGNWDAERERWLTPLAEAGVNLAIWGADYWGKRCQSPALRAAWRGRPLFGHEQALAAAASKILVNVLRIQNKDATNMRTFEIPATGAFMAHERSPAAAAFFPPGEAAVDFTTPEELVAVVRRWLPDEAGRAAIAAEGHRRALAWTYREWALKVLECLEGWAA